MKRFLFPALVLCAALATACNPSPNNNNGNSNGGGNQNRGNINTGAINSNSNGATLLTADPKNKAVMVTVSEDDKGNRFVSVTPSTIYMSKVKGQKLRFYVFDDLDIGLDEIKVQFKAAGNPMEKDYDSIKTVPSGNDSKSESLSIKSGQANGSYPYKIVVTLTGGGTVESPDPDVEVGN